MSVLCAKCGEELIAAINRCWRCGTEYEYRSGQIDVPPRRRAPIRVPLEGSLEAEVVDDDLTDEVVDSESDPSHTTGGNHEDVPEASGMRRGSPFRVVDADSEVDETEQFASSDGPAATIYPKHGGAGVGAIVAITLGFLGLGLAYLLPIASFLISAVGLGIGVWGLYSKRRNAAILGLLLCCAAIALSGFFGSVEIYRALHGYAPWETDIYTTP